ncbi:quinic acid utilization activator [Coccidioides immitis H538.4]|uniref:Quinic acid utilization activator n=1 Tax=Coccidioides immitis H538.4 TaxID=396776 RepID=A0A0J8RZ10_COCIT|nr:quinic acid utilization activator [Coccidioides immitis H538.4]
MEDAQEQVGRRRKRVSRACDRCRSKKDRCDGTRPTCLACQNSGSVCSYDPSAKKRGLPEGYVRGLEKLWALSISNIDGFEESVLGLLGANDEPSSTKRRKLISLWLNESVSEKLHDSWKSTALYRELEKLLSAGDIESVLSSREASENRGQSLERTESHTGSSDGFEYRISRDSALSKSNNIESESSIGPRSKKIKLSHAPSANPSHYQLRLPLSTAFCGPPTPIQMSLSPSPGSLQESGGHAALSSTQSPGVFIPSEKENFEIGHVQALLLLTLVNIGLEDWTAAWLLSNQATSLVLHLGLGRKTDRRQHPGNNQNNAIFLGCFVVDAILAVRLGRCPHMRPEDLIPVGPLEEDGLEEWNPWMEVFYPNGPVQGPTLPGRGPLLARSCFHRLVELASFLNRISRHEPYSFDAQWLLRLTPGLLSGHSEVFGQFTFPPLFECSLRTITDCIRFGGAAAEQDEFQLSLWLDSTSHEVSKVGGIWPVMTSFSEEISNRRPRGKTSYGNQPAQSLTVADFMNSKGISNNYHASANDDLDPLSRMVSSPQDDSNQSLNHSTLSAFGLGLGSERANNGAAGITAITDLSPRESNMDGPEGQLNGAIHAELLGNNLLTPYESHFSSGETADLSTVSDQFSTQLQPATPASTPPQAISKTSESNSQLPPKQHLPINDLDSIFDDFAHLDTNEWTTRREQGLKDFGFADEIAFQAFCRDPDRVAATNPLLRPASIADIWPPPGFFPDTFRDEKEATGNADSKERKVG